MKQLEYKIGDHVVIEESNIENSKRCYAGKSGTIINVNYDPNYEYRYCVHLDDWITTGGIYCKVKCLVKEPSNDKVVITTDGVTTTATLYSKNTKVRTATAKCSPDDEFDFAVGAKLAMERLYPEKIEPKTEPAPKYLNCKFIVTDLTKDAGEYITDGKVYTMIDGRFENDLGSKWPYRNPIETACDLVEYFNGKRSDSNKERAFTIGTARPIIIKE